MVRRKATVVLALGSLAALAACSAIIGTRDLTFESGTDAGPTGTDSGAVQPDSSIGQPDSATGPTGSTGDDGGAEASADAGSDGAACGADLTSDMHNCGACSHDCLGGQCVASLCQPVPIVAGQQGPWGLALSATNVYWSNYEGGQIMTARKDGQSVTVVAHDPHDGGEVSSPIDVATDDTYVYWADALDNSSDPTDVGRIARCPLAGCNGAPSHVVVTNISRPTGMKVDDAGVYWADYYGQLVASANKANGTGHRVFVSNEANLNDVAVDPPFIYWSTQDAIKRANKDAGGPDGGPYASLYAPSAGLIFADGIAVDDTSLYFCVADDPGLVQSIPKGGVGTGAPKTYGTGLHLPVWIAYDATSIYWVNLGPNTDPSGGFLFASGTVMTCPKAGCGAAGPATLATQLAWPKQIAVDATAIYFTVHGNNTNDGAIMRLAK